MINKNWLLAKEQFWPDCKVYEDDWGYQHLVCDGEELTKDHKCIACWFVSKDEWYYQNERGRWKQVEKEKREDKTDGIIVEKRNKTLPISILSSMKLILDSLMPPIAL